MRIGNREIKPGNTFIVAEMSANHCQSYDTAIEIIRAAKYSGADAIKIQTLKPEKITINHKSDIFKIKGTQWENKYLYDIYDKVSIPYEWHFDLQKEAQKNGLIFFSSPFSVDDVDFLESLNVPVYKIASCELVDHILLKRIAQTKKPVIMSTGMANMIEIMEAVDVLKKNGTSDICLLKCTSAYPAKYEDANLKTLQHMASIFDCLVGLSDHSLSNEVPITSVALGGCVIEKHLKLKQYTNSLDDNFSLSPNEFKNMVDSIRITEKCMGTIKYSSSSENDVKKLRRSLFVVEDIKKGEHFTINNVKSIRPNNGLHTKYYDDIIGKIALYDIKKGTPLNWSLISC